MTEQFLTPFPMPLPAAPSGGGRGGDRGTDLMERNHPINAAIVQFDIYRNNSGATVPRGSVVVLDATGALYFTTSTTQDNAAVIGVTLEQITNGARGRVATSGRVMVRVAAGTTAGQYLRQSTTAGVAEGTTSPTQGTFGFARSDRNATTLWSEATLSVHALANQAFAITWKVKTADESVNNTTTFQADDDLTFTLKPSLHYAMEGLLLGFDSTVGANIKIGWTASTLALYWQAVHIAIGDSVPTITTRMNDSETISSDLSIGGTTQLIRIHGVIVTTPGSPTLTLRWAQNAAVVGQTYLQAGSYIRLTELVPL